MRYAARIAKTTLAALIALGGTVQAQDVTKYKDAQIAATYLIQGNCTLTTVTLVATEFKTKTAGEPTSSDKVIGVVGNINNTCTGEFNTFQGPDIGTQEVSVTVNGNLSRGKLVATDIEVCDTTELSFCVTFDINVEVLGTGAITEITEEGFRYQERAVVAGSPTSLVVKSFTGQPPYTIGQNILSNAILIDGVITRLKI